MYVCHLRRLAPRTTRVLLHLLFLDKISLNRHNHTPIVFAEHDTDVRVELHITAVIKRRLFLLLFVDKAIGYYLLSDRKSETG